MSYGEKEKGSLKRGMMTISIWDKGENVSWLKNRDDDRLMFDYLI